jgi:hypothetical protein
MRISIQLITDPDPSFHYDAYQDPNPQHWRTVQVVTVSCPRLERLNLAACGWIRPEALEYHAQHHFRHRTIHFASFIYAAFSSCPCY